MTITTIGWLMLFTEIRAVYSKNYMKPINKKCRLIRLLKLVGPTITAGL